MRARFTTDEIAAAALRIVDESGVGALSMRSLAAALGTGPMTLYNYVADKEGLEELVVAAIVAEVRAARPDRRLAAGRVRHRQRDVAGHPRASRRHSACVDPPHVLGDGLRRGRRADRRAGPRRPRGPRPARRISRACSASVVGAAQAELAGPLGRRRGIGVGRRRRPSAHRGAVDGRHADVGGRGLRPRAAHAARRHRDSSTRDGAASRPTWPRCSSWPR